MKEAGLAAMRRGTICGIGPDLDVQHPGLEVGPVAVAHFFPFIMKPMSIFSNSKP